MKNILFGVMAVALAMAAGADTRSSYSGQEAREIKTLSQQEIQDYLNGNGLGYAKAAELNHYPGPRHVLDLADRLALTGEQSQRTQAVFNAMKAQATALGKQLVDKERELDRRFASGSIDTDSLKTLVSEIGALQAKIRYVHLHAHLQQQLLLNRHQLQLYDRLRGYGASRAGTHDHSH